MNPKMFNIISMTINLPRQLALDVSPCQTGAIEFSQSLSVLVASRDVPVEVLMPLPIPAITLEIIISDQAIMKDNESCPKQGTRP